MNGGMRVVSISLGVKAERPVTAALDHLMKHLDHDPVLTVSLVGDTRVMMTTCPNCGDRLLGKVIQ